MNDNQANRNARFGARFRNLRGRADRMVNSCGARARVAILAFREDGQPRFYGRPSVEAVLETYAAEHANVLLANEPLGVPLPPLFEVEAEALAGELQALIPQQPPPPVDFLLASIEHLNLDAIEVDQVVPLEHDVVNLLKRVQNLTHPGAQ